MKKMLCIVIFVILLIGVGFTILLHQIKNFNLNNEERNLSDVNTKFNNLSQNMIDKIKTIKNNKYIYLYNDLLEIDNTFKNGPLGSEIDKGSYITYYDSKIRVCISDSKYKIYGDVDNLKTEKIVKKSEICHYEFADIGKDLYQHNEGEYYLKYLIPQKYNLEVQDVKTNYDCSSFTYCLLKNYEVLTSNGTITAELTIKDNQIEETDNYIFVYVSRLLQENLIKYMDSNKYTIKPYIVLGDSKLTDISNINIDDLNNEVWVSFTVIIKKDYRPEEEMKQIANKMIEWYKNHKVYGSTNFILLNQEEYEKINEDNYLSIKRLYDADNLISCTIKENGDVEIY